MNFLGFGLPPGLPDVVGGGSHFVGNLGPSQIKLQQQKNFKPCKKFPTFCVDVIPSPLSSYGRRRYSPFPRGRKFEMKQIYWEIYNKFFLLCIFQMKPKKVFERLIRSQICSVLGSSLSGIEKIKECSESAVSRYTDLDLSVERDPSAFYYFCSFWKVNFYAS